MAKLKRSLILTLAAVFSVAGVLSLLTSPALAAGAITPLNCANRAQGIIDRTRADIDDLVTPFPDEILTGPISPVGGKTCFNACTSSDTADHPISRSFYLRDIPGQGQTDKIQVAVTIQYFGNDVPEPPPPTEPPTEVAYGATLGGQIAFDCSADTTDPADGPFVVVVGHDEEIFICGTDLTQVLCSTVPAP